MRTLIVCALLAFLAISFVQARPNEEESDVSDSLVANTTENNVVNDSETTEADETEEEGEEAGEEEGDTDEDDDEEESTSTTTTEAPKHKKIFWPRFGGHGPVVIHPRFKAVA